MTRILHILTKPEDTLVQAVMADQQRLPDVTLETVDLTTPEPDYGALVEKIFEADSVQVW